MESAMAYAHHRGHRLGIYRETKDLVAYVRDYLEGPLAAGEAALLLFHDERRAAVIDGLAAAGHDVDRMQATGAVVQADTEEVLRAVVVRGRVDTTALDALVVSAWASASADRRRVHFVTDAADAAWRRYGRSVAEAIEHAADAFVAHNGGTLLCNYAADLLEVMDERTEATIQGHWGTCITVARDRLDAAMAAAFDQCFGAPQRRSLQVGDPAHGGDAMAERLVFWVNQNRRGDMPVFLTAARAAFENVAKSGVTTSERRAA